MLVKKELEIMYFCVLFSNYFWPRALSRGLKHKFVFVFLICIFWNYNLRFELFSFL